jgi:hypothetical protein
MNFKLALRRFWRVFVVSPVYNVFPNLFKDALENLTSIRVGGSLPPSPGTFDLTPKKIIEF